MLTKKDGGHGRSSWCIGRACLQGLVRVKYIYSPRNLWADNWISLH